MGALTVFTPVLPSKITTIPGFQEETSFCSFRRKPKKKNLASGPVARLFGPAIFEASKLKVLILGVDEKKHPGKFQRTYTLTHSDITSKLTLAISHTINNSQLQGWYNWLQRDEVVAQWKKVKETMSLHVHCHISGGHFLLDLCARLRYYIFCKELPVVLNAFVHGDVDLFKNYPELLQEALVWVYFHSNIAEFNKVECWGSLKEAAAPSGGISGSLPIGTDGAYQEQATPASNLELLKPCQEACDCCFPPMAFVPCSAEIPLEKEIIGGSLPIFQQRTQ